MWKLKSYLQSVLVLMTEQVNTIAFSLSLFQYRAWLRANYTPSLFEDQEQVYMQNRGNKMIRSGWARALAFTLYPATNTVHQAATDESRHDTSLCFTTCFNPSWTVMPAHFKRKIAEHSPLFSSHANVSTLKCSDSSWDH